MAAFDSKTAVVPSTGIDAKPFVVQKPVDSSGAALAKGVGALAEGAFKVTKAVKGSNAEDQFKDDITQEIDPFEDSAFVSEIQSDGVVQFRKVVDRAAQASKTGGTSTAQRAKLRVETSLRKAINTDPAFAGEYRKAAATVLGDFDQTLKLIEARETAGAKTANSFRKELIAETSALAKTAGIAPPIALVDMSEDQIRTFHKKASNKINLDTATKQSQEQSSADVDIQTRNFNSYSSIFSTDLGTDVDLVMGFIEEGELVGLSPTELEGQVRPLITSLRAKVDNGYLVWENSDVPRADIDRAIEKNNGYITRLEQLFTGEMATVARNKRYLDNIRGTIQVNALEAASVLASLREVLGDAALDSWISTLVVQLDSPTQAINEIQGILQNASAGGGKIQEVSTFLEIQKGNLMYDQMPPEEKISNMKTHVHIAPDQVRDAVAGISEPSAMGNAIGFVAAGLTETTSAGDAQKVGMDVYGDTYNNGYDVLTKSNPAQASVVANLGLKGAQNGINLINRRIEEIRGEFGESGADVIYSGGQYRAMHSNPVLGNLGKRRALDKMVVAGNNYLSTAVHLKNEHPDMKHMTDEEVKAYVASGGNENTLSEATRASIRDANIASATGNLTLGPQAQAITEIASVQAEIDAEVTQLRLDFAEFMSAKSSEPETSTEPEGTPEGEVTTPQATPAVKPTPQPKIPQGVSGAQFWAERYNAEHTQEKTDAGKAAKLQQKIDQYNKAQSVDVKHFVSQAISNAVDTGAFSNEILSSGLTPDEVKEALENISKVETSGGSNVSVSSGGASGILQVIPSTFKDLVNRNVVGPKALKALGKSKAELLGMSNKEIQKYLGSDHLAGAMFGLAAFVNKQ